MSKTAHILTVRAGDGAGDYRPARLGYDAGEVPVAEALKAQAWIGPRPVLEMIGGDGGGLPPFLQLIPYVLVRDGDRFLRYRRPTSGGDARLHNKTSIGIGGHIDLADVVVAQDGSIDLPATLVAAARREAGEEIAIEMTAEPEWAGTIYSDATEVDRVHLGLVAVFDLDDASREALRANHEIGEHAFLTADEIRNEPDTELETWTRLILETTSS